MRRWLPAFCLCFLAQPAFAVEPFPDGCKLQPQAILPFQSNKGHVTVEVGVNGHPQTFVIDTGGAFSAIDANAVTALGLETHDITDRLKITDIGGAEAKRYARIGDLTIGKTRAQGLTLMVLNLGMGEDGTLAPDLLRNFDLDFDFDAHTLILFKPHRCDDHVVYWADDFSVVPFVLSDQGHIRIDVTVNGQSLRAIVDTGAPRTLVGADAAARISAAAASGPARGIRGASGGSVSGAEQNFDSLAIGKVSWKAPTLLVTSTPKAMQGETDDMVIGLDRLSETHFFIDYRNKQIFLSRRPP